MLLERRLQLIVQFRSSSTVSDLVVKHSDSLFILERVLEVSFAHPVYVCLAGMRRTTPAHCPIGFTVVHCWNMSVRAIVLSQPGVV